MINGSSYSRKCIMQSCLQGWVFQPNYFVRLFSWYWSVQGECFRVGDYSNLSSILSSFFSCVKLKTITHVSNIALHQLVLFTNNKNIQLKLMKIRLWICIDLPHHPTRFITPDRIHMHHIMIMFLEIYRLKWPNDIESIGNVCIINQTIMIDILFIIDTVLLSVIDTQIFHCCIIHRFFNIKRNCFVILNFRTWTLVAS